MKRREWDTQEMKSRFWAGRAIEVTRGYAAKKN